MTPRSKVIQFTPYCTATKPLYRPGFKYVHTVTEQDAEDIKRMGFTEWLLVNQHKFAEVADTPSLQ